MLPQKDFPFSKYIFKNVSDFLISLYIRNKKGNDHYDNLLKRLRTFHKQTGYGRGSTPSCHRELERDESNDRAVLDMIRRYSVKYGAAHLKHDTMADKIGKSNVTVRRAIRKLEKLGIIERITTSAQS